jgi:hypothetical protein
MQGEKYPVKKCLTPVFHFQPDAGGGAWGGPGGGPWSSGAGFSSGPSILSIVEGWSVRPGA